MSDNPPSSRKKPSLLFVLLPLAPIVLAVGVALSYKQFAGERAATGPAATTTAGVPVGSLAPDFSLPDVHKADGDEPVTLSLLAKKSPVLVVFILGYNCPRCTAHLGELDARREEYEKAGIQIVAISPDLPANLRDSIKTYGDFDFPFLSDRDAKVARAFGLRDDPNNPLHGTFLVDTQRRVAFAAATDEPFTDMDQVLEAAKKLQAAK